MTREGLARYSVEVEVPWGKGDGGGRWKRVGRGLTKQEALTLGKRWQAEGSHVQIILYAKRGHYGIPKHKVMGHLWPEGPLPNKRRQLKQSR